MIHTIEQRPGRDFNELIEKVWMAPKSGGQGWRTYEILPDGNFDLLFVLSETGCRVLYTGPYTELRRVRLFDRYEYFCVRFRPGRMPRVFDVAASDLVNSWAMLPKILGTSVDEVGEPIFRAGDLDTKRKLIEDFFRKAALELSLPKGPFLQYAAAVDAAGGVIRVDELANQAGVTTRTLERMFLEHTGLSPKTFARMIRFQNVLARLKTRSFPSLVDLAVDCGYTDQSHFIKEFKALSQRLPTEF